MATRKSASRNEITFEAALKLFKKANAQAQDLARVCSEMALSHFYKHGDLVYCQQFFDAMVQNWNRRVAYFRWLQAHAPIIQMDGALAKDKSPEAVKMSDDLLKAALETPFWDFAPEPGIVDFDIADIDQAIRNVIARFHNERMKPKTERVLTYLDELGEKLNKDILMTAPKEPKGRKAPAASASVH